MFQRFSQHRVFHPVTGIILTPFLILYACQLIWTEQFLTPLTWMLFHPAAVWLFWFLVTIICLSQYGIFRRLSISYVAVIILCLFGSFVSYYKYTILEIPLELGDFSLIGALGDIVGFSAPMLQPTVPILFAVILGLATLFLLHLCDHIRISILPGFLMSTACLMLTLLSFQPGIIENAALRIDVHCNDQKMRCDREGVILGLYTALASRQTSSAEVFGADAIQMADQFRLSGSSGYSCTLEDPDIIFLTSESFFDITRLPELEFSSDPLPYFHTLSETCTNGRFLSSNYGGGTGNVEMAIFTGISDSWLREGDTLCTLEDAQYETIPNMVRVLKTYGYSTTAIHSHNSLLYNRSVTYPAIGFEKVVFLNDFLVPTEYNGTYISDDCLANEIITRYEKRDKSEPCFIYAMSMENHQAYSEEKYGILSGFDPSSDLINSRDLKTVDSLVMGLHSADSCLEKLVEYFSHVDRPILFVFVGDHLPCLTLADSASLYSHLGVTDSDDSSNWSPETLKEMLSTDYLIWSNYENEPSPDQMESCIHLGLTTLNRAGIPLDSYFRWLQRDIAPDIFLYFKNRMFVDAKDFSSSYTVPDNINPMLEKLKAVQYTLAYTTPDGLEYLVDTRTHTVNRTEHTTSS